MKKPFLFLSFLLIVAISSFSDADDFFNGQWVDLTHEFSEETIYWPTAESI